MFNVCIVVLNIVVKVEETRWLIMCGYLGCDVKKYWSNN